MYDIWRSSKGFLYYELLKPGETVTVKLYKDQLQKLSQRIQKLGPHLVHTTRKVLLFYNNERFHVAILELGWELMPHPAYSPNLAPSDYYLLRSLQHSLSEKIFMNEEEVRKCIDFFISYKCEDFNPKQNIYKYFEFVIYLNLI